MKSLVLGIVAAVAVALLGGTAIFLLSNKIPAASGGNVTVENGVQIIQVEAKGGYHPRHSVAKAGIPTILRFNTKGTFDCSSSVRIPGLGVEKMLPATGATDIALNAPVVGLLRGSCGMGMYLFEIDFQS